MLIEFNTLVNIAELVGGIAVIVSLVFLAFQMRENNLNTRDANYHQVMQHNIQMGRMIGGESGVANIYRRGCDDMQQLNEDERWQYGSLMIAMFCDFNEQFSMHRKGRLDQEFWEAIEHNIHFYLSRPGVQMWWTSQPFRLDNSFTAYIEAYLDQIVKPAAIEPAEAPEQ